jgi:hypothetical protein
LPVFDQQQNINIVPKNEKKKKGGKEPRGRKEGQNGGAEAQNGSFHRGAPRRKVSFFSLFLFLFFLPINLPFFGNINCHFNTKFLIKKKSLFVARLGLFWRAPLASLIFLRGRRCGWTEN